MQTAESILMEMDFLNKAAAPAALTTPSQPLPSGPATAGQTAALDELVDDVIRWLASRWSGQIARVPTSARTAVVEGWREALAGMTPAAVGRARAGWTMPYPPDPGAFAVAGERQEVLRRRQSRRPSAGGLASPRPPHLSHSGRNGRRRILDGGSWLGRRPQRGRDRLAAVL